MEENKNSISDEALDEISGGTININALPKLAKLFGTDESTVKKYLKIAGVTVAGAGALGATAVVSYKQGLKQGYLDAIADGYDPNTAKQPDEIDK